MQVTDTGVLPHLGRAPPGAVILQAAIDVVRVIVIDRNMVELGERHVAHKTPCFTAVMRYSQAAVVADDNVTGIVRVDPERMVIDVQRVAGLATIDDRVQFEGLAAVDRHAQACCNIVESIGIRRIGCEFRVIKGANGDIVGFVYCRPLLAAVIRDE